MENLWHKYHVQNKLTEFRREYVRMDLAVGVVHLLLAPVAGFLMSLGCQGKGLRI